MNFGGLTFTWDLFTLVFFTAVVLYAIFLGRNKIVGILVNFYISLAVVLVAGESVYDFIANLGFVSSQLAVTEFMAKTLLLVFVMVLLSIKSEIAGLDSAGTVPKLSAGVYGFLSAGLFLSTIFYLMSSSERAMLDSNFVNIVAQYFVAWVSAPIAFMIGSGFIRKS